MTSDELDTVSDEKLREWILKARSVEKLMMPWDPTRKEHENTIAALETEMGRRQGLVA